jgi:tricorn protease
VLKQLFSCLLSFIFLFCSNSFCSLAGQCAESESESTSTFASVERPTPEHGLAGYFRQPTISGNTVVFVCEDDLWTVPVSGGTARRLTAGRGDCSSPHLSPDGKMLAFVSDEEGDQEVCVMPATGGEAKHLTFLGNHSCFVCGWSPDGARILFVADAGTAFHGEKQAFSISPAGGTPQRLRLGHAQSLAVNDCGGMLIGRNNIDPARWKRYRGGMAGELWIDANASGDFKPLLKLPGNMVIPMWVGTRVFFLSDHEGVGNIYSCASDGSDVRRHTNHLDYYVRYPASDGKRIVYTAGARLYVLDPASNSESEIKAEAPSSLTQLERRFISARRNLESFSVHPKGHTLAVIARGQPFTMPLWEGAVVQHGVGSKVRYRLAQWLADGNRFVVVNDKDDYQRVELHYADQSREPEMISKEDLGTIIELNASPVSDTVALTNHRRELWLLDLKEKTARKIDHSPYDTISDLAWSPDGRWLAYSWAPASDQSIIRIAQAQTGKLHDVTSAMRSDSSPSFDPDGKYLYFLSSRDFFPVRDATQFNLSFPLAMRPYLVTLRNNVPSPLTPRVRPFIKDGKDDDKEKDKDTDSPEAGDQSAEDENSTASKDVDATADSASESKPAKAKSGKKLPARVDIDFNGIQRRLLAFPVEPGLYRELVAIKGRALYTQVPLKGIRPAGAVDHDDETTGGILRTYDFEDQKEITLQSNVNNMAIAADHKTLVYRSKDRLRVIDATKKQEESPVKADSAEPGRKSGWLDLDRIKIMVEPSDEWAQMLREAWRLQRQHYWNEQMSQVDWDLVYKRYAALLPRLRTRKDLSDLIWEMQGELGTSHAYELYGDYKSTPNYRRGFLGADLSFDGTTGGYKIDKIYRGDSWMRQLDSPLAEPGLNVHEGDVIVAVGGRSVSKDVSVDSLLIDSQDVPVMLTILPAPNSQAALPRAAAQASGSSPPALASGSAKSRQGHRGRHATKNDDSQLQTPTPATGKKSKLIKGGIETVDTIDSASNKQMPGSSPTTKRHIVVRTLKDEHDLRYREWVEANRRFVHAQSKGQVGYVHIPDMGPRGFAEFHRGFLAEYNHPALIVDVRHNGGGNVSALLLEKLNRKRVAYAVSRWGQPEPYPHESIAGPMVAITDQFAGSDGDIFSHCFKLYKLGPLVGHRTWGGVIGISTNYQLVDGTLTTQPEYSFWFKDVGWKVENYGTDPDYEVDIAPQDFHEGRDPQLAKALDLMLTSLTQHPVQMPVFGPHPSRALPDRLAAP